MARKGHHYRVRGDWYRIAGGLRAIELGTHRDGSRRYTLLESFCDEGISTILVPLRLEDLAERIDYTVCEDGDPPCGDGECERKHAEPEETTPASFAAAIGPLLLGLPSPGSAELHGELAPNEGTSDRVWAGIEAAMEAPSPIGIARGAREAIYAGHPGVPPSGLAGAVRKAADAERALQDDALGRGAELLIAQGFAVGELEIVHERSPVSDDFKIAHRSYVRVRSDAAVANAEAQIQREQATAQVLADALERARQDLDQQAVAWRHHKGGDGHAQVQRNAWAEHAERSAKRAEQALANERAAALKPDAERSDMLHAIGEGVRRVAEQRERIEELERQLEHERMLPALDRGRLASEHASELAAAVEPIHALADQAAGLAGQLEQAKRELTNAEGDARVLAHAYTHDSRPPQDVVDRALAYRAGRP